MWYQARHILWPRSRGISQYHNPTGKVDCGAAAGVSELLGVDAAKAIEGRANENLAETTPKAKAQVEHELAGGEV